MNVQTHRLFKDLLFLNGHIADPRLGVELAATDSAPLPGIRTEESPMNLFKSLWLLGGLQSIDPRIGEDEQAPFGERYGNRLASEHTFGKPRPQAKREPRPRAPAKPHDTRIAHC